MVAEIDVHALNADRASAISNHEPHLWNAGHSAHWLIRFRQHVVHSRNPQVRIEQHLKREAGRALETPRVVR